MNRLVVVGDALLDRDVAGRSERRSPDSGAPVLEGTSSTLRPGGAGLAALLAAADGRSVTLVAAFADDRPGRELSRELLAGGVDLVQLRRAGATAEKVRFLDGERPLLRLDRGGEAGGELARGAGPAIRAALLDADAVLVSDYGGGVAAATEVREALAAVRGSVPLVWDPHPRGADPVPGAALVTPNLAEATAQVPGADGAPRALARRLAVRWRADAVAVTLGERGAVVCERGGAARECAANAVAADPCGAGDRFAAAAAMALADGADAGDASAIATRAAARFLASGGVRGMRGRPRLPWAWQPGGAGGLGTALELAARTRAAGGVVVATGGCFDLLHVGHVRSLQAARSFGDRLIVLLNSDESVRRRKGSDRPLVAEEERAETLRALDCVDEVAIFAEDEPTAALRRLRPDVWAKGGDYQIDELPEAEAVASWGGRVAILPYLEGRSTTGLIEEVGDG